MLVICNFSRGGRVRKSVSFKEGKISSPTPKVSGEGWKKWTPRLLAGAVGLIFLFAGILKSTEMEIFIRQIRGYGIISHHGLLVIIAWGLVVAEYVLGTALVIGFLPRITIPISAFLLFIFLCATGWAWLTGVTEDCGCFGTWISRTPGEALIEDLLLLAALVAARLGKRPSPGLPRRLSSYTVLAAFLIGVLLPPISGIPFSPVNPTPDEKMNIGPELSGIQGLNSIDLRNGWFLVVLFKTDCPHCQDSVINLNYLAEERETPELVALCPDDEEQILWFRNQFQPVFPLGRVTDKAFWRLLGDGDVPRTLLVKDRKVLKVWDYEIPEAADITEALNH